MKPKKEIFLIPYAHLDTQWRWEFPTTIKKYIKNTLEQNIYLFEKYPEHRFNFTGALRYEFMKDYFPDLFEKVKKYVKEGRWHVVGTCLDETDTLAPSVESMIRNVLYGDRWAKEEFGVSSNDIMIPDCFGFPANMPSIMAHCGINGFSSQKLTWNSAVGVPFDIGFWKGPDGSAIVSALNPGSYVSPILFPIQRNPVRQKRLENFGKKYGIWKSFQYYGVGDIGGAPREKDVINATASVEHYRDNENEDLIVKQGSTNQFFDQLTDEEKQKLPSYEGDLLLIYHSAGTLTSATIMKRWNRKNEQMAFAAEVAATQAMMHAGAHYPVDKIKSAWYRTIQSQFHDILPGTSTPTAYEYSQNDEVVALKTWETILHDAALAIIPFVKGDGSILLFNPLVEKRQDIVVIELNSWDKNKGLYASVVDTEGVTIPAQISKNENGKYQVTFIPALQPLSWTRFEIQPNKSKVSDEVTINQHENHYVLENSFYRVKISVKGRIESIFHKKVEKELLNKPLAYEFQREKPKAFPAWNMDWKDRKKPPFLRIEDGGEVSILENGPLRCTLRIKITHNESKFVKEISLSHDSEFVEFTERIHWRELGCSLKLALNANMTKPEVTYNWETSRIQRGLNNPKQYEMPSRYWVDMSDSKWGISIVEDSKYGYDHPADETLRLTLIYTPGLRLIQGFRDQKYHDWGEHTIRYGIYGHEGDFKGTDHLARRFNQPVRSFTISRDESKEEKKDLTLFDVASNQLGILAVKKAEDSDGIVIRVYERYGTDLDTKITFRSDIKEVKEVNGREENPKDVSFNKNSFPFTIQANGIRTYIVKVKITKEVSTSKQKAIQLEYDTKLIGHNDDIQGLFPAELTPSEIKAGSISYHLAVNSEKNTVQCSGQIIPIHDDYTTLSILAGSDEETTASFKFLDKNGDVLSDTKCKVPSLTGFLGLWDTRIWKNEPTHYENLHRDYVWMKPGKCIGVEPGYVKEGRLEWFSTHTHEHGEDQAYQFGYLYTLTLDIPKGAKSILLPSDSRIHIVALTASQQSVKLRSSQKLHDKYDF